MKLLIHICCAPCLIHPLEVLRLKGFEVCGLFYNPNIHPFSEYNERKKAIGSLNCGIEVIYPDYLPQEFFREINFKEATLLRCAICWKLRLKKTARTAVKKGFECFTTTLLVSPYQSHEVLRELGDEAAREEGVKFHYVDFRPGFRKALAQARGKGIYTQKYCGCIYSKDEKAQQKEKCRE